MEINSHRQNQINALAQFSRHDCNGSKDPEVRSSCSACTLGGYHPKGESKHFINNAGWARVYIQAGKFIPKNVQFDFMAELASDNRSYADALVKDIRDYGINCDAGDFRKAVQAVLGIYD